MFTLIKKKKCLIKYISDTSRACSDLFALDTWVSFPKKYSAANLSDIIDRAGLMNELISKGRREVRLFDALIMCLIRRRSANTLIAHHIIIERAEMIDEY